MHLFGPRLFFSTVTVVSSFLFRATMAAKLLAGDSKAASEARSKLGEKGVTADTILNLDPAVRKRLNSAIANFKNKNAYHPIAKDYTLAEDDKGRRAVMARYILDAGEGKLSVTHTVKVINSKKDKTGWMWLHLDEVAKEVGSHSLAELMVHDMDDRESEYTECRKKGLKQYHFFRKVKETETGVDESTELKQKIDNLHTEDFEMVNIVSFLFFPCRRSNNI